ncbi:hypothetical protein A2U01_0054130, partial [Trifolium medium]|nr:hypothetical protein [Trifolium medium]
MKTISEEQLQAFILKAREKKNRPQATAMPDPLSQLVGEGVAAEGDETNAFAPPTKKKRATRSSTGRSLLQ